LLIARRGNDAAILSENNNYGETNWKRRPRKDALRWFVFNDRNMYRPGETVSIKGYVRKFAGGKFADVAELNGAAGDLDYVLRDARGNKVLEGKANLNAFGAFDFQLKLPDNLNLGSQRLELMTGSSLQNSSFTHQFQAREFRRPEFEVSARVETPAPFYVGDAATLSVEAKYYTGGFLPNAETNWKITAEPTNYTPPNRDDFTFGKFVPWWSDDYENNDEETTEQHLKGFTGADGKHRLSIDFLAANPARPFTIFAEARVQDVNRQTFAAKTNLLIHPSALYVGIKSPKNFVRAGERFQVEIVATDIDGKAVPGANVDVISELKDWRRVEGKWQEVTLDTQNCRIKSGDAPVKCDFTAKQGGILAIKAVVTDERGRRNESELNVWAAGGTIEPVTEVTQESARLIPDKKNYAPGDAAEVLVTSPFAPAEGVLTVQRDGIIRSERFTMNESSIV
jgi:uncharacterized protein YfaS (alpha-2-macroglobulin family)